MKNHLNKFLLHNYPKYFMTKISYNKIWTKDNSIFHKVINQFK